MWSNDGWKLSRKLLPAYQLVTHLAHSNHFRQSDSLHDIGQNVRIKEHWRTWLEWIGCHIYKEIMWGWDVRCCGEAPGINPPLSWKATTSFGRYSYSHCCRILLQSSVKIAANGSYLEFHDRGVAISDAIFFPFAQYYPHTAGSYRKYCLRFRNFVLWKVSK